MRKRNITMWLCMIALTVSLTAGCGQNANAAQETVTTQNTSMPQTDIENPVSEASESQTDTLTVCVTEITENTITAEKGTLRIPSRSDAPGGRNREDSREGASHAENRQNGETNSHDENSINPQGGGQNPHGGQQPRNDGRPNNGNFNGSGETITFQVADFTKILVESPQGNQDGTIEDISAGSILEIILDSQGQAEQIIIKNFRTGETPHRTPEETDN